MSRLYIMDVSAVVNTGVYSPRYAKLSSFGYPTAGINFFMQQLLVALYEMGDVVLCFDSPNFRRSLNPDYKSGRNHSAAAVSNIEVLYDYLSRCGFCCYKEDGYEADDIIDWIVNRTADKYSQIIIIGNDKDLAHSLQPNVMFRSCRSDMNLIRKSSFPNAVFKDVYLPYNMTSVYKCLCGCHSDSVSVFRTEDGRSGAELYRSAVSFYESNDLTNDYFKSTNSQVLKVWAEVAGFTETDMANLDTRIKLIFPAEIPETFDTMIRTANLYTIDCDKMSRILTMFNVAEAFKCRDFFRVQLTEEEKREMYKLADSFKTGSFNADKNLPINSNRISAEPLTIDLFEKDF